MKLYNQGRPSGCWVHPKFLVPVEASWGTTGLIYDLDSKSKKKFRVIFFNSYKPTPKPLKFFTVKQNHFGSVVSEIIRYS